MPYIITTIPERPQYGFAGYPRTAVATLDEARETAMGAIERNWLHNGPHPTRPERYGSDDMREAATLPESGDTIGPLPDGTVIEVKRVEWGTLNGEHGYTLKPSPAMAERILAAFNAA